MFMLVAFVAGIIYSATYRNSGNSVWAVTGVHLSVNVLGALLFGIP
jgi:membrane protease YdiL (CAAX protease family)